MIQMRDENQEANLKLCWGVGKNFQICWGGAVETKKCVKPVKHYNYGTTVEVEIHIQISKWIIVPKRPLCTQQHMQLAHRDKCASVLVWISLHCIRLGDGISKP
jgi:hypothetical protein